MISIDWRRNFLHEEAHQFEKLLAGESVLSGVGRDVLESPLKVLMLRELTSEGSRLLAAHPQEAVVGRQHDAVEVDHVGVFVISQDVVVGNIFSHVGISKDESNVFGTVDAEGVPKIEKRLLVVVHRDGGLRKLGVEELPQVDEVRLEHALLGFRQQKVSHRLEVGDQLGRSVLLEIGVLASVRQETEEELQDLVKSFRFFAGKKRFAERVGYGTSSSEMCFNETVFVKSKDLLFN